MKKNNIIIILVIILLILILGVGFLYYNYQQKQVMPNENINQPAQSSENQANNENQEPANIGPEVNTLQYCELLSGDEYNICVFRRAVEDNNFDLCQLINNQSLQESCLDLAE